MPRLATFLILAGLVTASHAERPKWIRDLDETIFKRIQLSGYRRLGYHRHTVSGDRDAYDSLNYSGQGGKAFTDFGQLTFNGRNVLGLFNFEGTFLDSRFTDPQGQKFSLDYKKHGWTADLGDIQGSLLNTNPYASFNKSLRGAQLGYESGRFAAKSVYSQVKGSARTITLNGNNTAGPYYLQNNQIISGSERVQVDGRPAKLGTDYVIDYEVGSITFLSQVVPPTSTIIVTYEAFGFNERLGTISGLGMSYNLGKVGKLGMTFMQQKSPSSGGLSTRLEKFQGFGAPSTPYFLQFEPQPGAPITIRVNGVLQTAGFDYVFDSQNSAVFYFLRFMPATDNIDVSYTPKPRQTVDGDRQVTGLDFSMPLGKKGQSGSLQLSEAAGRLLRTPTPRSGIAKSAVLAYTSGKAIWKANIRDVPSGFVGIETTTFNRNERAHDVGLTYQLARKLSFQASNSNASVSTLTTDTSGNSTTSRYRVTNVNGGLTYSANDGESWTLTHRRSKTLTGITQTKIDDTELAGSHTFGKFQLRTALTRQKGFSDNASHVRNRFDLLTAQLGSSWNPNNRLSLAANLSASDIKNEGKRGFGKDYDFNLGYLLTQSLRLAARYAISDAGALATLGQYTNGYGVGYDGNGFSGSNGSSVTAGATNLQQTTLNLTYFPNERFSASLGARQYKTIGSISSNSHTNGWSSSFAYDFGGGHRASFSLDQSRTTFLDSPLISGALTTSFYLEGSPKGRWSYNVGASNTHSSGTSAQKQDSFSFVGSTTYRLAPRHSLILDVNSGRTKGYLPQSSLDWGLTYSYRIWQSLALNASYRLRDTRNVGNTSTSGAYHSKGFDVELNFNVGR